ncbi:MAG: AbrB/MazE/SpoVT family DNA-binding domain-containing protein [Bacteroidota bacterium]
MKLYSTLTRKGQTTVPKDVRDLLRLGPRQKLAFVVEEGSVRLEPASSSIKDILALLGPPPAKKRKGPTIATLRKRYKAERLKAWKAKHG